MKHIALFAVGSLLVTACAGGPATTREKATLGGAALGAGTGAIIGSATGRAGTGALIGAGIGGLTGLIVGDTLQGAEQERARPALPPTPPADFQPKPETQPAVQVPSSLTVDPTRGEMVNATRWRVQVHINADPGRLDSTPFITLNPQERQAANLDIGHHRIIAQAFADTQFGPRLVGRYDRTVKVDPKSSSWSIQFGEHDFR